VLTPFIHLHLSFTIPTLGKLITGSREAYTYLPDSTRKFLTAEALADRLVENGFQEVGFRRLMFATVAVHWGVK
jgi:demethylmenaquinone methyltransferase/2-methoxy-6-polyprenyl-1,4-benzoquinol methylase